MKAYVLNKPAIVAWMIRHGVQGADLASKLGVHPNTFSRYLNGKKSVPGGVLIELAKLMGQPMESIVEEAGQLPQPQRMAVAS